MQENYQASRIEHKWQERWEKSQVNHLNADSAKKKFYSLVMFPYPSGDLHMGHMRVYTISDVISRHKRMQGYEVLNPMGFDAFGLPAENAALERGIHPAEWTEQNIAKMRAQLKKMGSSYDWSREIVSCRADYYRWTQWLFLKLYEKDLVYKKEAAVNWCPKCNSVLANEQVENGFCWRHSDTLVEKKNLAQWFLRITNYAEELLQDLQKLDHWPEQVKTMQANWIGKSSGAEIDFKVDAGEQIIQVYTTRLDTIYGVSYLVIAPEHPLVSELSHIPEISEYLQKTQSLSEVDRQAEGREKTGVFSGLYAINPFDGARVPVWVADYVIGSYGTGAVMGVPAHDQRDYLFAQKYQMPVQSVIKPLEGEAPAGQAFTEAGQVFNSGEFNDLTTAEAKTAMLKRANKEGFGREKVQYRLRDWLISRQRFWGTPIPLAYKEDGEIVPVPTTQLPVELPKGTNLNLAEQEDWLYFTDPQTGEKLRRETDTMDTFICSSWYFLRYADPHNQKVPFSSDLANQYLPVDQYVGGIEHSILHLLYARFFTKALRDLGLCNFDEPFERLLSQGMVTMFSEKEDKVTKMSKSKGNVVGIDRFIEEFGADSARLFMLFAGPPQDEIEWSEEGARGQLRFLQRVWRLTCHYAPQLKLQASGALANYQQAANKDLVAQAHLTIRAVSNDLTADRYSFNTAIARMIELTNALYKFTAFGPNPRELNDPEELDAISFCIFCLLKLLAPFAPHLAAELWEITGGQDLVHAQSWPEYDPQATETDQFELVVQINGKKITALNCPKNLEKEKMEALALAEEKVKTRLQDKQLKKIIVVPNRLVNLVIV
jgi:leucyl-tRNA synthetase